MIDNDFILVTREMVKDLTSYDDGVRLKAEQKARALLADPVPPAGGKPEVRAAFDAWFIHDRALDPQTDTTLIDGPFEPWRAWKACADQYSAHVARLQAEVERLKTMSDNYCSLLMDANSELTKARECIAHVLGLLRADKSTHAQHAIILYQGAPSNEFNQSAPADKKECTSCDGSGEFVDAIGDWRGYCSCPAGVELKNRPAPADKGHGEPHAHEWDINDQGTATVCSVCGVRSSDEQPAPVASPKMCDCNQGRLPCTCKEPAPAEFDKGAALESLAKQIYESWQSQPGYLPWVNGGNSLKQDEARRIASRTFELALANQVEE